MSKINHTDFVFDNEDLWRDAACDGLASGLVKANWTAGGFALLHARMLDMIDRMDTIIDLLGGDGHGDSEATDEGVDQ